MRSQEHTRPLSPDPLQALEGLRAALEVRKDRGTPYLSGEWESWMVYIDDLAIHQIISREELDIMKNLPLHAAEVVLERYRAAEVPGDEDVMPLLCVKVLGERSNGLVGRRDLPDNYAAETLDFALFVLSQDHPSTQAKQMVGGRWVRVAGMRQPIFSVLESFWAWMDKSGHRGGPAPDQVCDEMLELGILSAQAYTSMRNPVSDLVVATDASEKGGCVASTRGLTPLGGDVSWATSFTQHPKSAEVLGLVTFGDPVGAVRRCLDLMKLPPGAALSVVSSKPAERVVRRSYPDTEVICDQKEEDVFGRISTWVQETSLRQVRLEHLLLYVQSPKLDHHIAVEMVVEALRRRNWRLKITWCGKRWRSSSSRMTL